MLAESHLRQIHEGVAASRWIARSDRPWFQLVSFLLGTVVVLLVLIAYRLDIAINFQP